MVSGKFVFLDITTLEAMQAQWLACLAAIATAHQSYSIAGRTFTRADLAEVSEMVGEISYALNFQSGGLRTTVVADMGC